MDNPALSPVILGRGGRLAPGDAPKPSEEPEYRAFTRCGGTDLTANLNGGEPGKVPGGRGGTVRPLGAGEEQMA
jgi:hypothetical protein